MKKIFKGSTGKRPRPPHSKSEYQWQAWNPNYTLGLNHKKGPFSLQRRREMYRFLFRMKDQWNSNTKSRWAAEIRIEIRYRPRHGKMCCCSEILFEKGARSEVQKSYIVNQREESYSLQCESVTEELDGWLKTRMDKSSIIFSS